MIKSLLPLAAVCLFAFVAKAQPCQPLVVNSVNLTHAACPSGGAISVNASGTGLVYQFTAGPTGYATAQNTTGNFNTLTAGTYTVKVTDNCGISTSLSRTVNDTYPAFYISGASATGICSSNSPGGTVSATIAGGRSPYQYDCVLVGLLPVYGAATTSTNFSKAVTAFGVYRIYSKDACGEVRTYDINVSRSQPVPVAMLYEEIARDRPCAEMMDGLPTVSWILHVLDANGQDISFLNLMGSTYSIYKPNPANSITSSEANGNCNVSQGSLLSSGTVSGSNVNASYPLGFSITIPEEDVILIFTTACGDVFKYCYNFNYGAATTPAVHYNLVQQTCNASWANQAISAILNYTENMTSPVTYQATLNGGSTLTSGNGNYFNLEPANFPATFKATDACGRVATTVLQSPVQGTALQFRVDPQYRLECTNVQGATTIVLVLTGGDLQGIAEATDIQVTGGTATAVPYISQYFTFIPGYGLSNIIPGRTYKVLITNKCNEKDSAVFTVPANNFNEAVLNWNLTASVNSLCGQNAGVINANAHFTGRNTPTFYLYQSSSPNTVYATNNTGIFSNVPAGNYKLKFTGFTGSDICPDSYAKDSITVIVPADGVAQTITRKTVTNCESGGSTLNTGKAIIEVSGSAPFTYEIIQTSKVGTGAGEVFIVSSANNMSNTYIWDLPLAGDPSNTSYTFRSTDKCGNKVTTQGSLQPLNAPVIQSTQSPCVTDQNYTVAVQQYGGNFTYKWYRLPDQTTVLSTSSALTFPGTYSAANNGTYRCVVDLAGCVTRTKDITLNSGTCGMVLPVKFISFTATQKAGTAHLKWMIEEDFTIKSYSVEISFDGVQYTSVANVMASQGLNSIATYEFMHQGPADGRTAYYRIKALRQQVNLLSNVVAVPGMLNSANKKLTLFPNPAYTAFTADFFAQANEIATLTIYDLTGKPVMTKLFPIRSGSNNIEVILSNKIPSGNYQVIIQSPASKVAAWLQKQ